MNGLRVGLLIAWVGVLFPLDALAQEASMSSVLASSPNRANCFLYMDAPSIKSFVAGTPVADDIPDGLREVRLAGEFELKSLNMLWQVGSVSLKQSLDATRLAKMLNGYVETIGSRQIVWSPRQSYLVPMANNQMGLVRPADRKLASRWLRNEKTSDVSTYLRNRATQSTNFVALLLAIDLEDSWSPIAIEQRIATFESIKSLDTAAAAKTLSTIQGVRVMVSKKNLDDCIISMDFSTNPSSLLPVAKDFFVEVLSRNQSSIPEASTWKPSLEQNTISLRGTISPGTIDDLLGLFAFHSQATDSHPAASASSPTQGTESDAASICKIYFDKVSGVVKRVRDYSASNTGDRAQLNGRMANRIDAIPTLNVDQELVNYGAAVAKGLRGNMVALQTANISYGTDAVVNSGVNAYADVYGGVYYDVNRPYQYQAMGQGVGNTAYREIIAKIDQMEADMRRNLTEKYQVQF